MEPARQKPQKHETMGNEPVLLFDNKSNDSSGTVLWTLSETASFLKISLTGVRRLQQRRQIPFVKIGGSVRFLQSDLFAYVQKQRVESIDK